MVNPFCCIAKKKESDEEEMPTEESGCSESAKGNKKKSVSNQSVKSMSVGSGKPEENSGGKEEKEKGREEAGADVETEDDRPKENVNDTDDIVKETPNVIVKETADDSVKETRNDNDTPASPSPSEHTGIEHTPIKDLDSSKMSQAEGEEEGVSKTTPSAQKEKKILPYGVVRLSELPTIAEKVGSDYPILSKISFFFESITDLNVDAILNAANSTLMGGGGIDGVIHSAAGASLLHEECRKHNRPLATGQAVMTSSCRLSTHIKKIIHAVGPMGRPSEKSRGLLLNCYKRTLELCMENQLRSVALCCVSTGIYGYDNRDAAYSVLRFLINFLSEAENRDKFDRIVVCLFMKVDQVAYVKFLNAYLRNPQFFDGTTPPEEGEEDKGAAVTDKTYLLPGVLPLSQVQRISDEVSTDNPVLSKLSYFFGSITTLQVDAIVNAANANLMGGGGIDKVIHDAAGADLLHKECRKHSRPIATGDAVMTSACELTTHIKKIIHCVGPIIERDGVTDEKRELLLNCYKKTLELCVENGLRSVAFCCISTGIYGYDNRDAAYTVLKYLTQYLSVEENRDKFDRIILCLFLDIDKAHYISFTKAYLDDPHFFDVPSDAEKSEENVVVEGQDNETKVPEDPLPVSPSGVKRRKLSDEDDSEKDDKKE